MIRLFVLGSLDLRSVDGREARSVLAQPKRTALLAYLALAAPRGFHHRDVLAAMFWPEFSQPRARKALRQAVHFLRRKLGESVVLSRGDEELAVDSELVWCDAVAFQSEVDSDPAAALEHYRGDLLPGFFVTGAAEFERWLEEARTGLRRRAAVAATDLATHESGEDHGTSALHWARMALALAPDDERALRRVLDILVRTGDRAGALRTYREFAERFERELGVELTPETTAFLAVLRQPPPVPADVPALVQSVATLPTPPRGAPRARVKYALQAAGAVLVVTLGLLAHRPSPPSGPTADAVAVLPFRVRGARTLDYLRDGMVDLLSAKLQGGPELRTIDPRAVLAASHAYADTALALDPEQGRRLAERFGAAFYVAGDVVEVAGRLQLSAALYSRRDHWEPAAQVNVEGDAPQLPALVDQLVAQLLTALGSGRDTTLLRLAGLTTRSLPALKAYLEGASDFRAGRQAEAVAAFQQAVTEDTAFALAYYDLSVATRWTTGDGQLTADALARAARYADRLPPLARALLRGYEAYSRGDGDSAEAIYRSIVASHPDAVEGWFWLGETLFHHNAIRGRPFTESRPAFERVLALDSTDAHAIVHLARLAASEGNFTQLEHLTRLFLGTHPGAESALEMRTLLAFAVGDTAAGQRALREARGAGDSELQAVVVALLAYVQKLEAAAAAATLYARPTRSPSYLMNGHRFLAQIGPARGMWRHADGEPAVVAAADRNWPLEARALFAAIPGIPVPRAWLVALRDSVGRLKRPPALGNAPPVPFDAFQYEADLTPEVRAYLSGLLSARLTDTVAARASVTELKRLSRTPSDGGVGEDLAQGIEMELAWLEDGSPGALAEARFYPDRFPHVPDRIFWAGAHERFLKAEWLRGMGRDQEALQLYETFPREASDLVYLAPSQRRQAEIYEHMGMKREALWHYARFVDLWKDAEPELQELVLQAQGALTRLGPRP